jgi:hypothetical protein
VRPDVQILSSTDIPVITGGRKSAYAMQTDQGVMKTMPVLAASSSNEFDTLSLRTALTFHGGPIAPFDFVGCRRPNYRDGDAVR